MSNNDNLFGSGLVSGKDATVSVNITIDSYNIINKIKYKVFGDYKIEEMLKIIENEIVGLPIEEVLGIDVNDIIEEFTLTEEQFHYAYIIEEALKKATIECLQKQPWAKISRNEQEYE